MYKGKGLVHGDAKVGTLVFRLPPKVYLLNTLRNWWRKVCNRACHYLPQLSKVLPNFGSTIGRGVWGRTTTRRRGPHGPWYEGCSYATQYLRIIWRFDMPGSRAWRIHLLERAFIATSSKIKLQLPTSLGIVQLSQLIRAIVVFSNPYHK
jgi:hypothetical protein